MSSAPGDNSIPVRRTARVSNCQHPGLLVKSQVTRRTSAQKKADDKKTTDALAAKAATVEQGINRVADIENAMKASQAAASTPVKATRPCPKVIRKAATNGKIISSFVARCQAKSHLYILGISGGKEVELVATADGEMIISKAAVQISPLYLY